MQNYAGTAFHLFVQISKILGCSCEMVLDAVHGYILEAGNFQRAEAVRENFKTQNPKKGELDVYLVTSDDSDEAKLSKMLLAIVPLNTNDPLVPFMYRALNIPDLTVPLADDSTESDSVWQKFTNIFFHPLNTLQFLFWGNTTTSTTTKNSQEMSGGAARDSSSNSSYLNCFKAVFNFFFGNGQNEPDQTTKYMGGLSEEEHSFDSTYITSKEEYNSTDNGVNAI